MLFVTKISQQPLNLSLFGLGVLLATALGCAGRPVEAPGSLFVDLSCRESADAFGSEAGALPWAIVPKEWSQATRPGDRKSFIDGNLEESSAVRWLGRYSGREGRPTNSPVGAGVWLAAETEQHRRTNPDDQGSRIRWCRRILVPPVVDGGAI